jgi:2-keto-4-pentenoate hydratase/2-oxohepta-3-ene-1,7-dioic acid hydratase in catechol pathway
MNYRDHCHEQNVPVPKEPIVFCKFANAIAASGDAIRLQETEELDFEVELAVVMGRAAHRVSAEEARRCIAGYTVAHDVSARDWQLKRNGGQWFLGKSFDTFAPIGPAIVTSDELGDPHRLGIRCFLNDAPVQSSNTDQLIFRCEDLVAWVSRFMTLRPGDLIFTGTPPGVGVFRKPPLFLKHGDVVRCEIDGIGAITNRVEAAAPQRPAP